MRRPPSPGTRLFDADKHARSTDRPGSAAWPPANAWPEASGTDPALRVLWGSVITAVRTFSHPQTGRNVTLVGTMHIGGYRYFRELSVVVEELAAAGAEVHVEGITHRGGDRLSRWEQDRLEEADRWADPETSGVAVSLLRAESQGVRLRLPDGVRNIDLSHADLLRRLGWDRYRRLFAPLERESSAVRLGLIARAVIRFQFRHGRLLDRLHSLRRANREMHQVVIEQRNQVAYDGAVEAFGRGDVVLVWGTDHLPGLAARLQAHGFRLRHEEWFEACVL